MLFRMLFASARGQDEALVQSPDFSVFIQRVLRRGFAWGVTGYTRDVRQYLQPWSANLFARQGTVFLWHGTEDNWAPISMAEYLAERFPKGAQVERLDGLSHYSCLYAAAPRICAQLAHE